MSLSKAKTLSDLAHLLGYKPQALSFLIYKLDDDGKYKSFSVPKKNGGLREIDAPTERIKLVQEKLAEQLHKLIIEYEPQAKLPKRPKLSFGYQKDTSIVDNAMIHRSKRFVFNFDLKDFFGKINFGRVKRVLEVDTRFQLNPKIATLIAQIACYKNKLPQGSPCSPTISNIVGNILDVRLARLAWEHKCTYSRYVDDITISTNQRTFPEFFATYNSNEKTWTASESLISVIEKYGFSINPEKTRTQENNTRQQVTGLVVNERVNVRREYRKLVRAMTHHYLKNGFISFNNIDLDKETSKSKLNGMFGFINYIDKSNGAVNTDEKVANNKATTYRQFLIHREFIEAKKPTLLFEGKTDVIYTHFAIQSIGLKYKNLIERYGNNPKPSYLVKLFNHAERSTSQIMGLTGGATPYKNFIEAYEATYRKFVKSDSSNPVVIVLDNDKEGRKILNSLPYIINRNTDKPKIDNKQLLNKPFIHVVGNLYVVLIPKSDNNSDISIEDLFDQVLLETKIGSRSFSRRDDYDPTVEYGKVEFAKYVEDKYLEINFDGFSELLQNIDSAIDDYSLILNSKPSSKSS